MVTLGEKIKMFRNDQNISQFELETELNLGYGSISRIETNQIIPKRHTLEKIAKFLKLNDRKFDYLVGSRIKAPTESEIMQVTDLMKEVWVNPNVYILLRDDHFRLCAASKGILNLFKITEEDWNEKYYLRNIASVMLDKRLKFHNSYNLELNKDAISDLTTILVGFYYEMSYLKLEDDYIEAINEIERDPIAKSILEKIYQTKIYPSHFLINERQLKVYDNNEEICLSFYTEVIPDSTRFSFIHFFPKPDSFNSLLSYNNKKSTT